MPEPFDGFSAICRAPQSFFCALALDLASRININNFPSEGSIKIKRCRIKPQTKLRTSFKTYRIKSLCEIKAEQTVFINLSKLYFEACPFTTLLINHSWKNSKDTGMLPMLVVKLMPGLIFISHWIDLSYSSYNLPLIYHLDKEF